MRHVENNEPGIYERKFPSGETEKFGIKRELVYADSPAEAVSSLLIPSLRSVYDAKNRDLICHSVNARLVRPGMYRVTSAFEVGPIPE
jgi:hypothetical protein